MPGERRTTGSDAVSAFRETLDRLLRDQGEPGGEDLLARVIRVVAAEGRPMTLSEIAAATGLSVDDVRRAIPVDVGPEAAIAVSVQPPRPRRAGPRNPVPGGASRRTRAAAG